jgi:uncharacterized protein (TIGR03067 family)
MKRAMFALFAASFLFASSCELAKEKPRDDRELLQGTWIVTALEEDGAKKSAKEIANYKLVVADDRCMLHMNMDTLDTTFTIDPNEKPKHLDMIPQQGPQKGTTWLGIYELDGDKLKICGADPGGDRPTGFSTKKGQMLIVLKRDK